MKKLIGLFLVLSMGSFAAEEILVKGAGMEDVNCTFDTYAEYSTSQQRCFYGDVMTGLNTTVTPAKIRCANVKITCERRDKEKDGLVE